MRWKGRGTGRWATDGGIDTAVPPGIDPRILDIVSVPAGLWVRTPGGAIRPPDDPAFSALPDPDGARIVIIGAPGAEVPAATAIAGLLDAMAAAAPTARDVIVSVYGRQPQQRPCLAQHLSQATGRPVRAAHGLLLAGTDGVARVTAVDEADGSSWHPLVERSVYHPTGPSKVESWQAPAPGLRELGEGGYRLTDGWAVQVVPSGLALHPDEGPVDPAIGAAPFDPGRLDLHVDHPVAELPDGVLTALGRLADALPAAARRRLRVVLLPGTADADARRLRRAVPAPQHVRSMIDPDVPGPSQGPAPESAPWPEPGSERRPRPWQFPRWEPAPGDVATPEPASYQFHQRPPSTARSRSKAVEPDGAGPGRDVPRGRRPMRPPTRLAVGGDGRMRFV